MLFLFSIVKFTLHDCVVRWKFHWKKELYSSLSFLNHKKIANDTCALAIGKTNDSISTTKSSKMKTSFAIRTS